MDTVLFEIRALIEAIWRRRWNALILAWIICIVGWVIVATLPDRFESSARIYVDTDSMLGPLLQGIAVRSDLASEVAVMQRTLLSRPNLQQTARATDLDLQATTPQEMDALLETLAKSTQISSDGPKLYVVSYTNSDPQLAKAVVQALLTIFVEGNLGQSRADLEGARAFIARQIVEYESELKAAEQSLADFKGRNLDIIGGGNFNQRLDNARNEISNARFAEEEATLTRDALEGELKKIPQTINVQQAPSIVFNDRNQQSPLELRVQEMEKLLDAQLSRYTAKHPSVLATQASLDGLKERLKEEQDAAAEGGTGATDQRNSQVPNPLYEQVKLKLVDAESVVASLRRRVERSEQEAERLKSMAETAPVIEAELVNLTRDYGVIKAQYEELLSRRESARISQAADATTDAVNFRIIEPPHVPTLPAAPNRPLLLALALVAGLGAGIGFSVLLDKMESTFRAPESLSDSFGFPVLGSVSMIITPPMQRRRLFGNVAFGMACGSMLAIFAIVMLVALKFIGAPAFLADQESASTLLNRLPVLLNDLPGLGNQIVERIQSLFN